MSAVEPLAGPASQAPARRHLRPVSSRSAPARTRKADAKPAAKQEPLPAPQPQSAPDIVGLSAQLRTLERELRQTWSMMLEADAVAAGRVGHAGRLVHQAGIVLGDYTAIY